jgi:hypothetical protein
MTTAPECRYLWEIPKRGEIREGEVLVHNRVRPTWRLGMGEFRAWLQAPGPELEPCGCDWATELGEHYRVRQNEPARG